ncbi:UNVERIFIED_CONTAM: protein ASYMMETRIC LEAVES 2 [Sesamum angustifolium]|uniref:Protein ASYMMETRIC LEAVES 2 n=1 Tax=Sesamum angustifolium TaxID=2727405 RepID=A0AAW2PSP6_9LAMI
MASSSTSPCAACKFLRRKCQPECVFAPYFPPDQPQKFANVHKVFGASNVTKLLNELQPHQREDAVNSLAYEADMRLRDPVYGCVGVISLLQTAPPAPDGPQLRQIRALQVPKPRTLQPRPDRRRSPPPSPPGDQHPRRRRRGLLPGPPPFPPPAFPRQPAAGDKSFRQREWIRCEWPSCYEHVFQHRAAEWVPAIQGGGGGGRRRRTPVEPS